MEKLMITKGEFRTESESGDEAFNICRGKYRIATIPNLSKKAENKANCDLIVDALNTANQCDKLPSELLKENQMLIEALLNAKTELLQNIEKLNVCSTDSRGYAKIDTSTLSFILSNITNGIEQKINSLTNK